MPYVLLDLLCIPLWQVFGNNTSAQKFERIALAQQKLTNILFNDKTLIQKYNNNVKNVKFCDTPPIGTKFVQEKEHNLRKGVQDMKGNLKNTKLTMFVNDSLMVEVRLRIMQLLTASIESLFQVMGEDMPEVYRSNLSIDK